MKNKSAPFISIAPGMQGGTPCLNYTRMTVNCIVVNWWSSGESLESMINQEWPVTSRAELLVACWYAARYGTRLWRKRWHPWLWRPCGTMEIDGQQIPVTIESEIAAGNWDMIPLPPRGNDEQP